jgi:hypothetical protein
MSLYPFGWCVGKRQCATCPSVYQSIIEPDTVDNCICECHKEKNGQRRKLYDLFRANAFSRRFSRSPIPNTAILLGLNNLNVYAERWPTPPDYRPALSVVKAELKQLRAEKKQATRREQEAFHTELTLLIRRDYTKFCEPSYLLRKPAKLGKVDPIEIAERILGLDERNENSGRRVDGTQKLSQKSSQRQRRRNR